MRYLGAMGREGQGGDREARQGEGGVGRRKEDLEAEAVAGEGEVGWLGGSTTGTVQNPVHLGCEEGREQCQVTAPWGRRRSRGEERKGGGQRAGRRGVGG